MARVVDISDVAIQWFAIWNTAERAKRHDTVIPAFLVIVPRDTMRTSAVLVIWVLFAGCELIVL